MDTTMAKNITTEQWVKLLLVMLAFHVGVPVQVLHVLLLIQLPVNLPSKEEDEGSCTWTPGIWVRGLNRIPNFRV